MSVNSDAVCLTQMRSTGDGYVTGPFTGTLFGYSTSPISASPTLRRNLNRISTEAEDPFVGRTVLHTPSASLVQRALSDLTPTSREVTCRLSRDARRSDALGHSASVGLWITFEG
jgi:hypothetical protein